jgi:hypothetical protein
MIPGSLPDAIRDRRLTRNPGQVRPDHGSPFVVWSIARPGGVGIWLVRREKRRQALRGRNLARNIPVRGAPTALPAPVG